MSKRQFKSQASSSRAVSGVLGGGFGGFGSHATGSSLSYFTEPPNLAPISDPNVAVNFKNLSRKNGTTKSKALEDLCRYVELNDEPEEAILEAWVKLYPRLAIDNTRRVRELSHILQYELLKKTRKRMEKFIPNIVGSWLAGIYDRDRVVAKAASDGISSFLNTDDKVTMFWKRCQGQILDHALEAMNETPETLSDERSMSPDEVQATYFRVAWSSISLVLNLLEKLDMNDISKQQEKYQEYLSKNKRLWALASSEDAFVRRAVGQLLAACLKKQSELIESDLEFISTAFIAEALRSSQASSASQLVLSLERLTARFPTVWTASYKGKKAPLSRLRAFIEKGSQGGSPAYWQSLRALFKSLPSGVLPVDVEASLDFLNALRQGISNREEPKANSAEAWLTYFELVDLLANRLSDTTLNGKLFQESAFPIFQQYLHPTTERAKWSIGNSSVLLQKAFDMCEAASAKDAELHKSFVAEWNRLAEEFLVRLQTSLPEQSKDYHKSQLAVAAEGQRWFMLVATILQPGRSNASAGFLVGLSHKIITTSLETLAKRNGKPYSAAAVIEEVLRFSPTLVDVSPESMLTIRSFVEEQLPKLIASPSSTYLVSILFMFRSIPRQDAAFQKVWNLVIDELLGLSDDSLKWKIITTVISNDAATKLAQERSELQIFFIDTSRKALEGTTDAWPLFEASIKYSSLSRTAEAQLLDELLASLDSDSLHVGGALKAVEFISSHKPGILQHDNSIHVSVITKLLALTELSDSTLSTRAVKLRRAMETSEKASGIDEHRESPILHVIRENLETASPQSLAIETLIQQAESILKSGASVQYATAVLPDISKWAALLQPALEKCPNPSLGVMRPFAGAVFLIQSSPSSDQIPISRDLSGYSSPLRMALYAIRLLDDIYTSIPSSVAIDIFYMLSLTSYLVEDQLDLNEEGGLFATALDPDIATELREFVFSSRALFSRIIPEAKSWHVPPSGTPDSSNIANFLVSKFFDATAGNTPVAFYAARALSNLLQGLYDAHSERSDFGIGWLRKLDKVEASSKEILGAISILTGLGENFRSSQSNTNELVNKMFNRLLADITGVSAKSDRVLSLLIVLNAYLSVYDEDNLPVPQNRLVFAIKQILTWVDVASENSQIASEMFRALQRLLPAIKDVYGSYWETTLGFCISAWESVQSGALTDELIPMIGMSLKLYSVLRSLDDANDDLDDAVRQLGYQVSHSLVGLLQLRRLKETLPLTYTDDLLAREVKKIPLEHLKDSLSEIYSLLASDCRLIQSAAFDVLHRALPEAQQQLSVDIILEKRDAQLPVELLSLLLDAPSIQYLPDDFRENFPTSVRAYLLSWHLVYDSYSNASFKVRNDYSDHIKSEDCIGPLLDFIFDTLTRAGGTRQNISGSDSAMIRSYNIWQAADSESNEHDIEWLMMNLYYLALRFTPSLVKSWWVDCKSKQTKLAVEALTRKTFSPLVIEETLDEVAKWSEEQEVSDDEKELIIKISKRSREVFAGYEIDDMMMQIVIRLPESYPLDGVKVDGVNRVAVSEKKWISWMRIVQGVITFSNGSITDGLNIFRKNVIGALKGQTECAICYSIISSDKKMPDKRCQTCKNLFHSSCLFKWFASSNQSTCPLCRNPFNYGPESSKRALDRSRDVAAV